MNNQTQNGVNILRQVSKRAKAGKWSRIDAYRVGVLAIMCAMTESNLHMYANSNIPQSLSYPHDAVGNDHKSVGLFQQQVPMWGSLAECMSIPISTDKFINVALQKGVSRISSGRYTYKAVQDIQNSAYDGNPREANHYSDVYGGNYRENRARAFAFVGLHWVKATMTVK